MQVSIKWIGVNLRTPLRSYRNRYRAEFNGKVRYFHDKDRFPNGTYDLPDDKWDNESKHFHVSCDACGMSYEEMGKNGTTTTCPYCGSSEVINGI